ncbi:uncharacterized protein LAESUDRAFT_759076 [Laetiporus sulphureus 93-53]|uniref:Uncharacterized protein n=1 Tax=Laetiporus sulphureus 93-53 TaxID=1314785 RepID=A0A165EEZ5_9APHY|nr:uncharacterized protein LAESUDRAFT_759076 [Laetiporus sulphureus 93-53]KZT06909.1 hypothetical protein LAESUDRAFT_759076 [Laetiporus sulphureus 93-53]
MYLPDYPFPRRSLCPPDAPECGPGPTIGIAADPDKFPPTTGTPISPGPAIQSANAARELNLLGTTRNLAAVLLTAGLLIIALAIYIAFGRWPRKKIEAWKRRRHFTRMEEERRRELASRPGEGEKEVPQLPRSDSNPEEDKLVSP